MNAGRRATQWLRPPAYAYSQITFNAQACGAQVASEAFTQPPYQQIKLALDVHAASIVVGRMIDGAKAQPPQTFKPADFLAWVKKPVALAQEVIGSDYLPNGARETGLGHWLPGFLRSIQSITPIDSLQPAVASLLPAMPKEMKKKSNKAVDASHSRNCLFGGRMYLKLRG